MQVCLPYKYWNTVRQVHTEQSQNYSRAFLTQVFLLDSPIYQRHKVKIVWSWNVIYQIGKLFQLKTRLVTYRHAREKHFQSRTRQWRASERAGYIALEYFTPAVDHDLPVYCLHDHFQKNNCNELSRCFGKWCLCKKHDLSTFEPLFSFVIGEC